MAWWPHGAKIVSLSAFQHTTHAPPVSSSPPCPTTPEPTTEEIEDGSCVLTAPVLAGAGIEGGGAWPSRARGSGRGTAAAFTVGRGLSRVVLP